MDNSIGSVGDRVVGDELALLGNATKTAMESSGDGVVGGRVGDAVDGVMCDDVVGAGISVVGDRPASLGSRTEPTMESSGMASGTVSFGTALATSSMVS